VLFLETHVTHGERTPSVDIYKLSEATENEGWEDAGIAECGDVTPEELNRMKWPSRPNNTFWIQKEYLLQLLSDSVFDLVLEPYDCDKDILGSGATTARKTNSRVLPAGSSQPHKEKRRQELPPVSSQRLSGAVDVRRAQAGNVHKRDLGRV
jgi:hypothetical protein